MPANRVCTFAVLATLIILLVAGPANAAVVTRVDRQGDAPRAIDIASARYSYGNGQVTVRASIPALGGSGAASLSISRFVFFEAGHIVRIVKRVGQPARVSLHFFDHFTVKRRACTGVAGSWNDRSITLRVPISCIKGDATPQIFVQFGIQRGDRVDRAPAVRRLARN
jgi:hypothetical protein